MSGDETFLLTNIYFNTILKGTIEGLGSNESKENIVRGSKALGVTDHTLNRYDQDNSVCLSSGAHSVQGSQKELQMIIKELQDHKVFEVIPGQKHHSFCKPVTILHAKSTDDITKWVVKHQNNRYFKKP